MRSVSLAPIPVENSRDWLDYVSAWSGLVGALLAGAAIAYAAWQSAQSKKDLVRERRLEFELGLLAELRTQMSITQFQHLSGYVGALVRSPEDETDLPVLRVVVGVKAGPRGGQLKRDSGAAAKERGVDPHGELLKVAAAEIDSAIQRRLEK